MGTTMRKVMSNEVWASVYSETTTAGDAARLLRDRGYVGVRKADGEVWAAGNKIKWREPAIARRRPKVRSADFRLSDNMISIGWESPARALWLTVLQELWSDAFTDHDSADSLKDREEARKWFGSRGFRQVCYLAGVSWEHVLRKYREQNDALCQYQVNSCPHQ